MIATGKLTTYPARSRYQIVVERLELAGQGALMALLDKRRRALAAEGLFDEARKKPLPFAPRLIGVVTSPTGAVIRDILHRLEDRFPTHVLLWPVPVQGEGAAEKIAAAVARLQRAWPSRPDLLIVARGGGSIEDLWAFNEEVVVRAVAGSAIPIISAVGHETDTTLVRLRRRRARADADRRRRDRGAGAGRIAGPGARARRPRRTLRAADAGARRRAAAGAAAPLARARGPARARSGSGSTSWPSGCRARLRGRLDRARGELGRAGGALRPGLLDRALTPARASGSTPCGGSPSSPIRRSRWSAAMPGSRTAPASR